MTPATFLRDATADGVELRMVDGALKVAGNRAAVSHWLPAIREHKAELLRLLAANEPAAGPRLGDLEEPGRSAGWRIYLALLSPRPGRARGDDRREAGTTVPADPGARAYRWLIHFPDRDPVEATYLPEATLAEVLELHPDAIAAEPPLPELLVCAPAPVSEAETRVLLAWLDSIGETDIGTRAAVLTQCELDAPAKAYYLAQACGDAPTGEGGRNL